jgi:hypothetical protein
MRIPRLRKAPKNAAAKQVHDPDGGKWGLGIVMAVNGESALVRRQIELIMWAGRKAVA